jgi:hypothetical protein
MQGGRRAAVLSALAVTFVLHGATQAEACTCGRPISFDEASSKAPLAFEGRVARRWPVLIRGLSGDLVLAESYDFEVTRRIRGDFSSPTRIYAGFTMCDDTFNEGVAYRVVAWPDPERGERFVSSWCAPNQPITTVQGRPARSSEPKLASPFRSHHPLAVPW